MPSHNVGGRICQSKHRFTNNPVFPVHGRPLTGGRLLRSRPQFTLPNHLCCFTSLAPLRLPSRVRSSLSNKRRIQSLAALQHTKKAKSANHNHTTPARRLPQCISAHHPLSTHCETFGVSRKGTAALRIWLKVSLRSCPLKGVVAYFTATKVGNTSETPSISESYG